MSLLEVRIPDSWGAVFFFWEGAIRDKDLQHLPPLIPWWRGERLLLGHMSYLLSLVMMHKSDSGSTGQHDYSYSHATVWQRLAMMWKTWPVCVQIDGLLQ